MSQPLYQLSDEIIALLAQVNEEGELDPEANKLLDQLQGDLTQKADNIVRMIEHLEGLAVSAKAQADRMARLAKSRSNNADRLKEYLKANLERLGIRHLETDSSTLSVVANPKPSVHVASADDLPDDMCRIKTVREPDKAKILEAVQDGQTLAGVTLIRGTNLRIR